MPRAISMAPIAIGSASGGAEAGVGRGGVAPAAGSALAPGVTSRVRLRLASGYTMTRAKKSSSPMRLTLARNGLVAISSSSSASDLQRARSEAVGLSSDAKSAIATSPFHVARNSPSGGALTASRPFAVNAPSVTTTLTRGST